MNKAFFAVTRKQISEKCGFALFVRFSNWFIVLAVTVFADCPTDGVWSATKPGVTKSVTCEGETWGEMYRACIADGATGTWGNPDTQYCLPLYPAEGYGYVDFYYYISNSDYRRIQSNPSGIAAAINSVYRVPQEEVSVHYVGPNPGTPNV